MDWLTLITEFFKLLSNGMDLGKTLAPTDKMKEERLRRVTPRLTAKEYLKVYRKLKTHLILNKKQSVDAIVNLCCDGYDADDIMDFRVALYKRFPDRKHIEAGESFGDKNQTPKK